MFSKENQQKNFQIETITATGLFCALDKWNSDVTSFKNCDYNQSKENLLKYKFY